MRCLINCDLYLIRLDLHAVCWHGGFEFGVVEVVFVAQVVGVAVVWVGDCYVVDLALFEWSVGVWVLVFDGVGCVIDVEYNEGLVRDGHAQPIAIGQCVGVGDIGLVRHVSILAAISWMNWHMMLIC